MSEFGKVKHLMEIINSSATTMQDRDRRRAAIRELGDIGDVAAVPVLLDNINNPIFSITVMDALGKMDFKQTDEKLPGVITAIRRKKEVGSPYERICATNALDRLMDDKKFQRPENPWKHVTVRRKIRT